MAFDASGTFLRLYDWTDDRDSGVKIRADRMDAEFDGIATGLTTVYGITNSTVVNAQTGTSYAILNGDRSKLVTFSNGSSIAVTIAQAGTAGLFADGWYAWLLNKGAGTVTLTPTVSTVAGASTLVLTTNESALLVSDGTNYQAVAAQAKDATLTALAGVSTAADKLIYATGSDAFSTTDLTSVARTLIAQTTQALMRTSGLGMSANGSSLVAAADYAAMRALLDLEANTDFYAPGGTDVAIADGGTGQSTKTAGFDALSPVTTRGDIIVRDASNNVRLAVGASGTVLIGGTDPSYSANPSVTTLELGSGGATDTTLSRSSAGVVAVEGVVIPSISSTNTLTNKRVTPRIGTTASSGTPTPDADANDEYNVTALATAPTFGAPSGTPTEGQKLVIRIKDNGTARALSFNAIYRAGTDVALPTTTVISKTMYLGFIYNGADTKWDLVAKVDNI